MAPSTMPLNLIGVSCFLTGSSVAMEDSCRRRFGNNSIACVAASPMCIFHEMHGCLERHNRSRLDSNKRFDVDGSSSRDHQDECKIHFGMNETACKQTSVNCSFLPERGCFMIGRRDSRSRGYDGCYDRFGMNESSCTWASSTCMFLEGRGCFERHSYHDHLYHHRNSSHENGSGFRHEHRDRCNIAFGMNETACKAASPACTFKAELGCSQAGPYSGGRDRCQDRFGSNISACVAAASACVFLEDEGCVERPHRHRRPLDAENKGFDYLKYQDKCSKRFGVNETACRAAPTDCIFLEGRGCFQLHQGRFPPMEYDHRGHPGERSINSSKEGRNNHTEDHDNDSSSRDQEREEGDSAHARKDVDDPSDRVNHSYLRGHEKQLQPYDEPDRSMQRGFPWAALVPLITTTSFAACSLALISLLRCRSKVTDTSFDADDFDTPVANVSCVASHPREGHVLYDGESSQDQQLACVNVMAPSVQETFKI
eukprot:TRINITY_DN27323_c0_g2_i1.p1 TRINITY_DN27323_c0_g2~~TRINITY_DN27323_c0_g2_i1.p1  ORF type:complete len:484 (+),score=36.02 TRINITY_DN27323_c0_g2_i1:53-1504(+)